MVVDQDRGRSPSGKQDRVAAFDVVEREVDLNLFSFGISNIENVKQLEDDDVSDGLVKVALVLGLVVGDVVVKFEVVSRGRLGLDEEVCFLFSVASNNHDRVGTHSRLGDRVLGERILLIIKKVKALVIALCFARAALREQGVLGRVGRSVYGRWRACLKELDERLVLAHLVLQTFDLLHEHEVGARSGAVSGEHAAHGRTAREGKSEVGHSKVLAEGRVAAGRVHGIKAHLSVAELESLDKILGFGKVVVVWEDALTEGRDRVLGAVVLHEEKGFGGRSKGNGLLRVAETSPTSCALDVYGDLMDIKHLLTARRSNSE